MRLVPTTYNTINDPFYSASPGGFSPNMIKKLFMMVSKKDYFSSTKGYWLIAMIYTNIKRMIMKDDNWKKAFTMTVIIVRKLEENTVR